MARKKIAATLMALLTVSQASWWRVNSQGAKSGAMSLEASLTVRSGWGGGKGDAPLDDGSQLMAGSHCYKGARE